MGKVAALKAAARLGLVATAVAVGRGDPGLVAVRSKALRAPLDGGVGARPLADACDFARHCVLDLRDTAVETPEQVASRIRAALAHVPAERLVIAPDCGFKYLPRDVSFAKLKNMVQGRDIIRTELA